MRGGALELLESQLWTSTRLVIIEFPHRKAARAFVDSVEYAPVKPPWQNNARCTLAILDGT